MAREWAWRALCTRLRAILQPDRLERPLKTYLNFIKHMYWMLFFIQALMPTEEHTEGTKKYKDKIP